MDLRHRGNSFTFLRLFLALTVVFSHSYAIGGFGPDPLSQLSGGQAQLGFGAVLCFFIVSGFLITASAERQPIGWYIVNRASRILPGFWAVQLLTALVLAPVLILAKHAFVEGYFHSLMVGKASALSYLSENAFLHMRQYHIADLFRGHPAGPAVNGSLWSLGPELSCYLYLALFSFAGALRTWVPSAALFLAVYLVHAMACIEPVSIIPLARFGEFAGIPSLWNVHFRSLYVAFAAGMLWFQLRNHLRWRTWMFVLALSTLVVSFWLRQFDLIWPFALPYIVLFLAFRLPFRNVERLGDFSYGIYIYSFPIQQCLVLAGFQQYGIAAYISASLVLSIVAGILSWRYVEAPVLAWVRSLRARKQAAAILEVKEAAPTPAATV